MDRVSDGVQPMITHLESHVITTGLADMIGAAATISTVSLVQVFQRKILTMLRANFFICI